LCYTRAARGAGVGATAATTARARGVATDLVRRGDAARSRVATPRAAR